LKQFLYGLLYLGILALLLYGAYNWFLVPEASCSNGRADANENGIDCGGVCANACLPLELQELVVGDARHFVPVPGTLSAFAQVRNPNQEWGAKNFSYTFSFLDQNGATVLAREGKSFIYPGEIKYLAVFANSERAREIAQVRFTPSSPDWTETMTRRPEISIREKQTEIIGNLVRVQGKITNNDTIIFPEVELIAVFRGTLGQISGVSRTTLNAVAAGEIRRFTIEHPSLPGLDPQKTEIFISAARP